MDKEQEKIVAKLQKRESEIWAELEDVCEEHTLKAIGELIEVNLELETYCNQ